MKVVIDRDACQGNGMCVVEAPDVFELGDDGKVIVLDENPSQSMRIALHTAAQTCPTRAISIHE
jgi:ferredoxin